MMKGNFNNIIKGEKPVLIDFFAEWCGPCKMVPPILREVKEELGDDIRIIKIDTDKHADLSNRFQIRGVPTLMLFKDGEMKWRQSGVIPAHQLIPILQQHL